MLGMDLRLISQHIGDAVRMETQPVIDRLNRVIELLENIQMSLERDVSPESKEILP